MPLRKKVLLMGRSGAGKTSMRSIIFANLLGKYHARTETLAIDLCSCAARETSKISPTRESCPTKVTCWGGTTRAGSQWTWSTPL
jgi:GTPase SAR1 family protein